MPTERNSPALTMEIEAFRKIHPAEFYRKFILHNVRPDGRSLSKVRNTVVSVGNVLQQLAGRDLKNFCTYRFGYYGAWLCVCENRKHLRYCRSKSGGWHHTNPRSREQFANWYVCCF